MNGANENHHVKDKHITVSATDPKISTVSSKANAL